MSKKYIPQINNDNFVFPNNTLSEYDAEIIHDLKEDSVNGVITGFSPLTYSASTESVGISFTYQWSLNGAEPFISNDGKLNILSVHMQSPDKKYYKPWICVGQVQDNNVNLTYKTDIFTVFVTPQMMGQTSFTSGTFYFEVRFIGHRAIFPVSVSAALAIPTPTPTPTPTAGAPTPTPSPTPTPGGPTPTPTPTTGTFYTYYVGQNYSNRVDACFYFGSDPLSEVYASTDVPGAVSRFYTDTSLITPFIGSGDYYAWRLGFSGSASNGGIVSSGGFVSDIGIC